MKDKIKAALPEICGLVIFLWFSLDRKVIEPDLLIMGVIGWVVAISNGMFAQTWRRLAFKWAALFKEHVT